MYVCQSKNFRILRHEPIVNGYSASLNEPGTDHVPTGLFFLKLELPGKIRDDG